ncbi:MAG: hypothetical protein CVT62_04450 [Actinobacteria bacterium HGW-Actinobacteria-2]|nr:MAG: hypothetical protein CVT62_04450 [Actinobacteria bacterium HGW-Actinobacteria-2]
MNVVRRRGRATRPPGKTIAVVLSLALASWLLPAMTAVAVDEVTIPDANLRACVSAQLTKDALPADFTAANLATLTHLACLTPVADLSGIEVFAGVRALNLTKVATPDVTPLASLTGLAKLYLTAPQLTDPSPLSRLTGLDYLYLNAPQVTSYAFASPLINLVTVYLTTSETADPHDLAPLTKLKAARLNINAETGANVGELNGAITLNLTTTASNLAGLTLPSTVRSLILSGKSVTSVADLPHSESMVSLWLDTKALTSLDGVDQAPNLTFLAASSLSLNDVSALAAEDQLTKARLSHNKITSLPDLSGLSQLRDLDISYNSLTSLASLGGLALTDLNAERCPISSLEPLSGMRLNSLRLAGGPVTSLDGIANMVSATAAVHIASGRITDPSPLLDLPPGVSIALNGNQISDVSALADLSAGVTVDLSYNRIRDLSPLPDDAAVTFAHQDAGFITVDAGKPIDLGLRSITGTPVCPDARTGLSCEAGIATFAATSGLTWTAGDTFSGHVITTGSFTPPPVVTPPPAVPVPKPSLRPSTAPPWPPAVFYDINFSHWSLLPTSWRVDWYRDGTLLQSNTNTDLYSFHQATLADLGHDLTVCVTTYGGLTPGQTGCSAPLRLERGAFPPIQAKISGKPRVGKWLSANTAWAPAGSIKTYTWLRNGHRIKGWTSTVYRPKRSDRGKRISVQVTWRHPAYVTATTTSASVRIKR